MTTGHWRLWTILLGAVLTVSLAAAEEPKRTRAWQVQWENDTFSGTDEDYTNGLRISSLGDPEYVSKGAEKLARRWCGRFCPEMDYNVITGWALGQNFYTPEDIQQEEQVPDERPWAGWLYAGPLLQITEPHLEGVPRRQHRFELALGVVGPPALAEPVQKVVHCCVTGSDEPLGWDNQIRFEPAVSLNYLYRRILKTRERFDITPHFGFNLGNVQLFANAGATLRVGRGLTGFPNTIISPSIIQTTARPDTEWYLFVGADARAVGYNIFLDGNTIRSSHSVDRENFVYDFRAGFSYRCKNWRLTYTLVQRSEEFPTPMREADGEHEYASISVSYEPVFLQ